MYVLRINCANRNNFLGYNISVNKACFAIVLLLFTFDNGELRGASHYSRKVLRCVSELTVTIRIGLVHTDERIVCWSVHSGYIRP